MVAGQNRQRFTLKGSARKFISQSLTKACQALSSQIEELLRTLSQQRPR